MTEEVLVLLSGGLDSTTCLAQAIADGHTVTCLTVDYGQKHAVELTAARNVAEFYRIQKHLIVPLPFFREIGGSSLTSNDAVPKNRVLENNTEPSTASEIPTTYVPARNLIFLSIAVALAETRNIKKIYIGVNALDYSGYPDCRPEFIQSFAKTANLATRVGVETGKISLETPLLNLSKAEIAARAHSLKAPMALTHSCYDPIDGKACGLCDACVLRRKGFLESNIPDPTIYADRS